MTRQTRLTRSTILLAVALVGFAAGSAHAQSLPGGLKVPSVGGKKLPGAGDKKLPGADAVGCGGDLGGAAGVQIKAFIDSTHEVDKATASLEASVRDACKAMARELKVSDDGDTKAVCNRVSAEIKASLKAGVKGQGAVAVRYQPAVCKVNADFTADAAAKCSGRAKADVKVKCGGTCSGTCNGACSGTCAAKNASGQCAGECQGTCRGSCSGTCQGATDVDGSAECKASASAQGNLRADCSEPKVIVDIKQGVVVDAERMGRVERSLKNGLPVLLSANAKAKLVAKSVTAWAASAKRLGAGGGALIKQLGAKAVCVAGELGAAAKVATQVNVRVSVSVQASASVSGAAGAKAQ
jgi:hypothetical protein